MTARALSASQAGRPLTLLAVSGGTSAVNRINVYPVTNAGIGTRFSNPASGVAGTVFGLSFDNRNRLAVGFDSSPYLALYRMNRTGFGTKFADPPAGNINAPATRVAMFPGINAVFITGYQAVPTSGGLWAFNLDGPNGFSAAAPSSDTTFLTYDIGMAPFAGSSYIFLPISGTDKAFFYSYNGSLGARTTLGSLIPSGSTDSNTIGVDPTSPRFYLDNAGSLRRYFYNGVTFVQEGVTTSLSVGPARCLRYNPNATAFAAGGGTNPFVQVFRVSGNALGTAFSNPATLPGNAVEDLSFSPDGKFLAVCTAGTVGIRFSVYPFNSTTGFGTRLTNPATMPAGGSDRLAWGTVINGGS